ncbi:hypothetical protein LguiA_022958 [Lonicera macranthoides]
MSSSITEVSIIHHVAIVLVLLCSLSSFNCCHPVAYFASLIYLYLVHDRYVMRLRRNVQFEERRQANQRRVLSDSESVRWLNYAVEKMWVVCMEQIVSQKILLPIVPWFLQKYKPWTAKSASVQSLYLGRSPPMFTEMRVLRQSTDDDHLVLELGMNFRTAEDMSAILAVKLRKRLGFGILAKLHLTGMHIEGKVLIGVKFVRKWPFLGRMRVCFAEPPYFQMTVKPLLAHGLDVTELPGIAGWLDNLLANAFEETLVEPNMLVVDVEKFASPESAESWFFVDAMEPIAYVLLEVLEAADMKPSDLNGLADPYVKGQIGPYRFRTMTQKKTLSPKWHEEFKIPICTWESPNVLTIEVRDKDHFVDDTLGNYSINIGDLRDGQRHDMWLSLQNIKMGRLHLAITVLESNGKGADQPCDEETMNINDYKRNSFVNATAQKGSFSSVSSDKSPRMADKFEPIDIEGQKETGIWVHRPGTEVSQVWEPRKGKSRVLDSKIQVGSGGSIGSFKSGSFPIDNSSTDESLEGSKTHQGGRVRRGLHKLSNVFNKRSDDNSNGIEELLPSPHVNVRAVNAKKIGVKFVSEDSISSPLLFTSPKVDVRSPMGGGPESPSKAKAKDMTKSILKHAGRGLKQALSRKGSMKSKAESGRTERDLHVESESSDDEPPPPLDSGPIVVEGNSAVLNPVLGGGSTSFKKEYVFQMTPNDLSINIVGHTDKAAVEGLEIMGNKPPKNSEGNGGVTFPLERSDSKLSRGSVE